MADVLVPGAKKINHLVILMMENRSFDHYLGALTLDPENRADVEGFPNPLPSVPDTNNIQVPVWCMDGTYRGYGDPPHGWQMQHDNYNNGAMDGFVKSYQAAYPNGEGLDDPKMPMGYYTRKSLPVLYSLADNFTVCDHWFSSLLSSTWPNRKYLHSGQRDQDNDTQTLPAFPGFETMPLYNALEDTFNPETGHKCTWKCYFTDLPFLAFWYKFAAFHALSNFTSVDNFVLDCQQDQLPTVSIIDPPFSLADDHPAHDVRLGQKFIGLIIDALTTSEAWEDTALVLLYDENGAFYDHAVPPDRFTGKPALLGPDTPLGFRVPALIVSPYSGNRVCKTVFDHTSIMKSINLRWNVPFDPATYGTRWEMAPDIWSSGAFDFDNPTPLKPGIYTGQEPPFASLNWETGIQQAFTGPVGGVEQLLERLFLLPALKVLDRRNAMFETLHNMEQKVVSLKRMSN